RERRIRADEVRGDAETLELGEEVPAERIVADPRDERRRMPVPCDGDGHVGGRAAEVLAEGGDIFEAHAVLKRVDVDAEPADGQYVWNRNHCRHTPLSRLSGRGAGMPRYLS